MQPPTNLNLRQTIEGMTLAFDPETAGDLDTTIQFDVTGPEPGVYQLRITDGECTFHTGLAAAPTITIFTPSEVWLQISQGELDGQQAMMEGLYRAEGDFSLLLKLNSLFKSTDSISYKAEPGQRPGGPIPLRGMTWMTIAFLPWMVHWITFDIPGVSHWISVGLPLLLAGLIVGYRLAFDKPAWMEIGGLGFFALAGVVALTGDAGFAVWGSVISSVVMGGLWLATLRPAATPLSADYSKWGYAKALWHNSMFLYPNAVISLMWGWQFIVAALLGAAAILLPDSMIVFTIVRYLLLVPAFIFTSVYQSRATQLRVADYDEAMGQLRSWARIGLLTALGLFLALMMLG
ncbi:MAG: SCP2 sterol-binding domain-containing protein [Chloroflexota bacterium]|nr:SCP2 sterol-binding domain-containing protein [Chloroflexota bacterium]